MRLKTWLSGICDFKFKKDLAEIKGIEILGLDKIESLITKLFE